MTVAKKIKQKIDSIKEGTTFKYYHLGLQQNEYIAAAKAMERLIKKDKIKRISTGVFYKPVKSIFGELYPNEEQLLKTYLFQGSRRIAYITGKTLYNRMGLTTQVPEIISVACRIKRISINIGTLKIKTRKSYTDVTNKNYKYLEILDAIKDFRTIPDIDFKSAISILKYKIENYSDQELYLNYSGIRSITLQEPEHYLELYLMN